MGFRVLYHLNARNLKGGSPRSNSALVVTGPDQAAIDAQLATVRKQIAFYWSTRSYSKILDSFAMAGGYIEIPGLMK
ncbi:MAG: hypothetical protein BZY87_08290 [SAR202 cluster bacterium Io17-Chloro-G6]|nr:MAG: hypothetical protein BZY87_08290 [SAR202 cluster bacterium Io17-Chloro-G6]